MLSLYKKSDGWDCSEATKKALAQGVASGEIDTNKSDSLDELSAGVEEHLQKNFWTGLI